MPKNNGFLCNTKFLVFFLSINITNSKAESPEINWRVLFENDLKVEGDNPLYNITYIHQVCKYLFVSIFFKSIVYSSINIELLIKAYLIINFEYPTNTTSGQIGECIPRDKHTDLIPLLRNKYVDIHRCQWCMVL